MSAPHSLTVRYNPILSWALLGRASGRNKKVPVYRYMSRGGDWDAVTAAIGSAPGTSGAATR